jgi:hypothetical protein
MQNPKSSEAGQLAWESHHNHSPAHSIASSDGIASSEGNSKSTYYENELARLRQWHPRQSRFRKECEKRSSSGGGAPPHSFHDRDCFSPEH